MIERLDYLAQLEDLCCEAFREISPSKMEDLQVAMHDAFRNVSNRNAIFATISDALEGTIDMGLSMHREDEAEEYWDKLLYIL